MNSIRPPGRSTLAISSIDPAGSETVHSTSVQTTVSKLSFSKGSDSAGASTTSAATSRSAPASALRRRLAMCGSGSVRTSPLTPSP